MKGGFLQSSKGLGGPETAVSVEPGKVRWTAETLQTVVKIMLITAYEHTTIADLKQRLLQGSAKAKPQESDTLSKKVLKDVLKPVTMAECAPAVLEKCSSIWKGMMSRAKNEGHSMTEEEMLQVRKDILKE